MRTKKGRVSIISRESNDKTLDIEMLEAELRSRGIKVTVLSRLLTKERSLKALGYAGHILRQEAAILASDAVILDTYCIPASMLPHRKGTKIIQMWHALSAIKKFGWQTVGKEGGSSEKTARIMRMHHGYDYVVSPSDITAEHFSEAFRTDRAKVIKYGLPRIDYIKSVSGGELRGDMLKKIYEKYPQLDSRSGKLTILYAPTFRRGKAVDAESLIRALGTEKYNIVVKLHPLYREKDSENKLTAGIEGNSSVIFDEEFPSFDWLAAADIIISDYSSFVVESTLADRPLYIYAYDLEEYSGNTGLNVDFDNEPISKYVFRSADELAAAVSRDSGKKEHDPDSGSIQPQVTGYDMEALRAFRDRYIDIETGDAGCRENYCTGRFADFIEALIEQMPKN